MKTGFKFMHCPTKITKLCLPPSINWLNKKFYSAEQKQWFGDKVQDCKDGSGNFDFVTGGQEIKVSIQLEF